MRIGETLRSILSRLRPVGVNLALAACSLAIGAFVAEGAVRLVAPQQLILIRPDLWMPADTVGWTHWPNVTTRVNTGERSVTVFTDARGFRVGESGPASGDFEVLLLGDSFMEALQVEYEDSMSGLLETALSSETGAPVAVRNAGVGGWGPEQYLSQARMSLERDPYDLVITAIYLGNDMILRRLPPQPPREHSVRYSFRIPRSLSRSEIVDALLRPINDVLEVRSHLYILLRSRLQTVRMRLGLYPLSFPQHYLKSDAGSVRWQVTADIIADIADVAERHGSPALFVLIPAPFQVDSDALDSYVSGYGLDPEDYDLDLPNDRMREELTARGITFIDALETFRASSEGGQKLYGQVDPHLTPVGHEVLTNFVAPAAASLLRDGTR